MSFIHFNKSKLVNLEYSLQREILRTNRAGSYACTTLVGCNTRKYHGLLITPQPKIDSDPHVLLSSLDLSVVQNGAEFNLGIRQYADHVFEPKGHKYLRDYTLEPIPAAYYRVGGVVLKMERIFMDKKDRLMMRLTLVEAHSQTFVRFKPFLAFRNVHFLTKANDIANTSFNEVDNGISMQLYNDYTPIYMQFSKDTKYTHKPQWYYNIEYIKEIERGYDGHEDLLQSGVFETELKKGESVVFSAGTEEANPTSIKRAFTHEVNRRTARNSFENCLENAAAQFITKRGKRFDMFAGFPYFGKFSRDLFIALPGLTLSRGDETTFKNLVVNALKERKGAFFPTIFSNSYFKDEVSVDTSLWFITAIQRLAQTTSLKKEIWQTYGNAIKEILNSYRSGESSFVKMDERGLIYAKEEGRALTWMDAVIQGVPVVPRYGYAVEVNALWYNAICFAIELATAAEDTTFINDGWISLKEQIPSTFTSLFWSEEKQYLADSVDSSISDWSVRPNQIMAASLPYSPLKDDQCHAVLNIVKNELLTDAGIRTLSPKNSAYKSKYSGNQEQRDNAYHNGPAFPWLLEHFAEGYLRIHGKSGLSFIKQLYNGFSKQVLNHGIGTISELYEPDPPYRAAGAISHAMSVAALLRTAQLINELEK